MRPSWILIAFACLCFCGLGCGGGGSPADPGAPAGDPPGDPPTEPPTDPPLDPPADWPPLAALAATRTASAGAFATAPVCATCHANSSTADAMRDATHRPVGPMDLWRASAMAASGRDPFWRAVVSAETATIPAAAAAIEATCTRCHLPMAHVHLSASAGTPSMALLDGDTTLHQLALDGTSCTLCHQITAEELGEDASYSGQFHITTQRLAYALHDDPNPRPMSMHSGYTPVSSAHARTSASCGTCHTLFTGTLASDGTATGFAHTEQAPYLEWRNSVFNDETAVPGPDAAGCVDCHMPAHDEDGSVIQTQLAHAPSGGDFGPGAAPVRGRYNRHVLVGGNTLLPRLLRDHAAALGLNASAAALDATAAAAGQFLAQQTARLLLTTATRDGEALRFTLRVENLAGHRFPTAYPSRRAWLRVRVRNGAGAVVFASGEHDTAGRLLDAAGAVHPTESPGGSFEPHHDLIEHGDRVQIYEPIMRAADGSATWRLLQAAGYVKDNRLLPRGWSPRHAEAARAGPHGAATRDTDFVGGRDDVSFGVTARPAAGPYSLEADLLYQVIDARYAAELFRVDTAEIASFRRMFEAAGHTPALVAHVSATLP